MSIEITLLVLLAALLHAIWNYLAKTIPSGAPFVWLLAVVMCILWFPVAAGYIYLYGFNWSAQNIGIFILYALRVAPVHLVAPTREISIVLGVIFGAKLLTEENFRSRIAGALLIMAGIVFLSQ